MSWFRRRKETPSERTSAMLETRYRIYEGRLRRSLDEEIAHLIALQNRNKPIRDLAGTEGWQDIEEDLVGRALSLWRELPRKIVALKWEEVLVDAITLLQYNQYLGLVNETLFESACVQELINSHLTMKQRYEEQKEEGGRV